MGYLFYTKEANYGDLKCQEKFSREFTAVIFHIMKLKIIFVKSCAMQRTV